MGNTFSMNNDIQNLNIKKEHNRFDSQTPYTDRYKEDLVEK